MTENINNAIKAKNVFLINEAGEKLGVVHIKEALYKAKEALMDLVEVGNSNTIGVPVCKIMDYGKWKYEQSKKEKKSRQNQQKILTKEIKFRPNTGENDLKYRAKQAEEFLKEGHKVKLTVRWKGREGEHINETGKNLLEKYLKMIEAKFNLEGNARFEERTLCLIISPVKE